MSDHGVTPNSISGMSVVMAALGGFAFLGAGNGWIPAWTGWILGAVFIQLRLICNLLDGMVAVEGGHKTPTGELWNEIPDRIADAVLLVCAGFASGVPWIGAIAAWAAVMTAYIRAFGASLTGEQDFSGPLAKPQRMAVLTVAAVASAFVSVAPGMIKVMHFALLLIVLGTLWTATRRTLRLAKQLRNNEP